MKVFVVEDDPFYGNLLKYTFEQHDDMTVDVFDSGVAVLDRLHESPDLVTIDYGLPDTDGETLFNKIKGRLPSAQVLIISGQEDIKVALNLLSAGAYDYVLKDDDAKARLQAIIRNLRMTSDLKKENAVLREKVEETVALEHNMIGSSSVMEDCYSLIKKAAKTTINVTISGETGTGKEMVANAVHFSSERKGKRFVPVNVAAIPKDLIESELFGHEKGAFTGANSSRIGRFEESNGGTIFLDEIGELDVNLQAKLLRVLQEGEVTRVGGDKPIKFNARLITATHKNLSDEVSAGRFREDLYYRIVGLPIVLPPLRERGSDIISLAESFLKEFAKKNGTPVEFDSGAKKKLMGYHYPGNVREIKGVVELAAVMSDGTMVQEGDITFNSLNKEQDLFLESDTLKGYTQKIIQMYLDKNRGDVKLVAEKLDIGKSKIYQMIKDEELKIK